MAIKYAICFGDGPEDEWYYETDAVCLGSNSALFHQFTDKDSWRKYDYQTMRRLENTDCREYRPHRDRKTKQRVAPCTVFRKNQFRGLKLYLDTTTTDYGKRSTPDCRKDWDYIHDTLLGHAIDYRKVNIEYNKDGTKKAIFYHKSLPIAVMMSSLSMYRIHDNYTPFYPAWEKLEKYNFHPMVRFAVAMNVGHMPTPPRLDHPNSDGRINIGGGATHLPWHSRSLTAKTQAKIMTLTPSDMDKWRTLESSYESSGYINYNGREAKWRVGNRKDTMPMSVYAPTLYTEVRDRYWGTIRHQHPLTIKQFINGAHKMNDEVIKLIEKRQAA